jgi:mannose-6-phosphate isomerase-like protein (cupin superfamily)
VLIRPGDVPEIEEPSNDLVMRKLVDAAAGGGDLSVTWVRIEGSHRPLRTDATTRLYYVVEGAGWFELGDEPRFDIRTGDVVVVSRGTPYALGGDLTYLVINGPAFREGDDLYTVV